MKRLALILAIWICGLASALAQNVTVIGPITPGDCPQFSSTTVIKDSGFNCNGSPVPFANPTGAVGLTAVPGSASTAMRSDAAPPLSASVQSALTGISNLAAFGTGAFGYSTRALVGTDIPAINLAAGGNGGVTGSLPNSNLANPSTTVNGQTCTLGATCIVPTGAWRTVNVQADNDATNPSTAMDLTADYAVFYNPSTGATNTVIGAALTKICAINSTGAGGRDQSSAFTGGQVIWFYYINGTSGTNCVTSATAPSSGGPSFSLRSGYSAWAPAFPVALVTTATLLPLLPQGGSTPIRVRGNFVSFPNVPLFSVSGGGGAFISTTDLSAWVPRLGGLMVQLELDPEMTSSAGPTQVGFLPMAISGDLFGNLSVYLEVTGHTAAQNMSLLLPIGPSGHIYSEWDVISGTPTGFTTVFFLQGYSFSNGG